MMKHKKPGIIVLLFIMVLVTLSPAAAEELVFHSAAEAVDFALQNSPVWTIRRQKALLGMEAAKLGIQDFLPSFGFSLAESDNVPRMAGDSRNKSLQLSFSQEIFDGGKKFLAYEAGRISALYTWQEFEGEWRNFLSSVMSLYYQYLLLQEKAAIREDLLRQGEEQLAVLKRETELGITLETDYLEYAASYMEIEQERDQGLRDLSSMERRFKTTLNLNQGASFKVVSPVPSKYDYFYYEPHMDYLWILVRNASIELKKQRLNAEYSQKQYKYSKLWYLPVIQAQGSVSFSGNSYPLTEPVYSLRLTFDFSSLDFLSLRISNESGFERGRLSQLSNGISGDLRPLPAYPAGRKQQELNLLESVLQQKDGEQQLRENLYELVISYDNTLRAAQNAEQRIELMEKRLQFSRLQLEKGEKKRVDYLAELSGLAQTRISLAEYLTQAAAMERNLEIQTNFPFGGLADVCRKYANP
jgi:outer membrane protein TolC